MVQEYKVPNDNINYCITFSNVSRHTIRRLLPHEKDTSDKKIQLKDKNNTEKNSKRIKMMEKVIPFLAKKDYIKVLYVNI